MIKKSIATPHQDGQQTPAPQNGHANGHLNGHAPATHAPATTDELRLCAIIDAFPLVLLRIPKDKQPARPGFKNPIAGCLFAAQSKVAEEEGQDLRPDEFRDDVRFRLSLWAVESEQPKNAACAVKASRLLCEIKGHLPSDFDLDNAEQIAFNLAISLWLEQQERQAKKRSAPASSTAGGFALDEIGNGQRFAEIYCGEMRFCSVREQWLIFKRGRWQPDETGAAELRAKAIGRAMAAEAAREVDEGARARLLKHALTLTKRATRETMLKDAASEPGMMVTPEQFDCDPHLFNLANGTLDLKSFEFRAHAASDVLSHQSPVNYDAAAVCPAWRACMARWLPDEATRAHVQDAAGASLSGTVFDEFFVFLYGDGDNGKSTFLRVLELLSGSYSHKTQAETIMTARDARKPGAPSPELLALKGARLVTVHEIDSRHQLNATLIKDLTGRDSITARGLFEKRPTTFEPQFTLWMFGNGKPQIRDTSGGMWRRPRLISFGQPIPPNERDPRLGDKLRAELPGILNWALEGLRRVQQQGLIVPDTVKAATAEYRAEQDPLAGFISECCIIGPAYNASASELWAAWGEWCRENGEREGTQRSFGIELKRRKFEGYSGTVAGKTARRWRGIGIVEPTQPTQPT